MGPKKFKFLTLEIKCLKYFLFLHCNNLKTPLNALQLKIFVRSFSFRYHPTALPLAKPSKFAHQIEIMLQFSLVFCKYLNLGIISFQCTSIIKVNSRLKLKSIKLFLVVFYLGGVCVWLNN